MQPGLIHWGLIGIFPQDPDVRQKYMRSILRISKTIFQKAAVNLNYSSGFKTEVPQIECGGG